MAGVTGPQTISGLDLYVSSEDAPDGFMLGARVAGRNGEEFRLVKAGGSALVVGNVIQSPAYGTAHNALTPLANAAGSMRVKITNSSTTFDADAFAGGTLTVDTTPGLGEVYTIVSHTAGGNAEVFEVELDRPLRTAWTTSSRVTLRRNECNGVIQSPTTLTGNPVGVAIYAIPANEYGWVQSKGVGAVLSDNSSIIMGSAVAVPSATAGAMTLLTAGKLQIGSAMQAESNGKTIPVSLNM